MICNVKEQSFYTSRSVTIKLRYSLNDLYFQSCECIYVNVSKLFLRITKNQNVWKIKYQISSKGKSKRTDRMSEFRRTKNQGRSKYPWNFIWVPFHSFQVLLKNCNFTFLAIQVCDWILFISLWWYLIIAIWRILIFSNRHTVLPYLLNCYCNNWIMSELWFWTAIWPVRGYFTGPCHIQSVNTVYLFYSDGNFVSFGRHWSMLGNTS